MHALSVSWSRVSCPIVTDRGRSNSALSMGMNISGLERRKRLQFDGLTAQNGSGTNNMGIIGCLLELQSLVP